MWTKYDINDDWIQLNLLGFSLVLKGISYEFKIPCFPLNCPLFLFPEDRFSCSPPVCCAVSFTCRLIFFCREMILVKTGLRNAPSVWYNMSVFSNFHHHPLHSPGLYEYCLMWPWLFLSFLSCTQLYILHRLDQIYFSVEGMGELQWTSTPTLVPHSMTEFRLASGKES